MLNWQALANCIHESLACDCFVQMMENPEVHAPVIEALLVKLVKGLTTDRAVKDLAAINDTSPSNVPDVYQCLLEVGKALLAVLLVSPEAFGVSANHRALPQSSSCFRAS